MIANPPRYKTPSSIEELPRCALLQASTRYHGYVKIVCTRIVNYGFFNLFGFLSFINATRSFLSINTSHVCSLYPSFTLELQSSFVRIYLYCIKSTSVLRDSTPRYQTNNHSLVLSSRNVGTRFLKATIYMFCVGKLTEISLFFRRSGTMGARVQSTMGEEERSFVFFKESRSRRPIAWTVLFKLFSMRKRPVDERSPRSDDRQSYVQTARSHLHKESRKNDS